VKQNGTVKENAAEKKGKARNKCGAFALLISTAAEAPIYSFEKM